MSYMQKNQGGAGKTSLFGSTDQPLLSDTSFTSRHTNMNERDMNNSMLMDGSMSVNNSKDSIMIQSRESKSLEGQYLQLYSIFHLETQIFFLMSCMITCKIFVLNMQFLFVSGALKPSQLQQMVLQNQ